MRTAIQHEAHLRTFGESKDFQSVLYAMHAAHVRSAAGISIRLDKVFETTPSKLFHQNLQQQRNTHLSKSKLQRNLVSNTYHQQCGFLRFVLDGGSGYLHLGENCVNAVGRRRLGVDRIRDSLHKRFHRVSRIRLLESCLSRQQEPATVGSLKNQALRRGSETNLRMQLPDGRARRKEQRSILDLSH